MRTCSAVEVRVPSWTTVSLEARMFDQLGCLKFRRIIIDHYVKSPSAVPRNPALKVHAGYVHGLCPWVRLRSEELEDLPRFD